MVWVIIKRSDLEVLGTYEGAKDDSSTNRDHKLAEPISVHMLMPDDLDPNCLRADDVEGEIVISEDDDKLQARRDNKLSQLRLLRDSKLQDVDVMVNEVALELRSDKAAIATYRQALLDLTDDFKKVDGHAKVAIDNLDLNEVEWPEAPEAE